MNKKRNTALKIKCHAKINCLSVTVYISFFLLCVLSFHVLAETTTSSINDIEKELITIIPLNITAEEKDQNTIRMSAERFLLQRLNGQRFSSETANKLAGLNADELNKIYTGLNSNRVDDRIKDGDNTDYVCGGNVIVLGRTIMTDFFLYHVESGEKVIGHNASGADYGIVLTAAEAFTGKVKALLNTNSADTKEKKSVPVISSEKRIKQENNPAGTSGGVFIKSDKVTGEITSVVFSKLDSIGKSYVVYSLAEKIVAMEVQEKKLAFKSEFKNNTDDKIVGMVSIDIDQDGVEELVVSNIESDNKTINSYVLKWENETFVKTLSNLKWIFSSSGIANSNDFLYAQKNKTLRTLLDSGVFKVTFKNGKMVVPENPLPLPEWVHLPGLVIYPDSDPGFGVAFRSDDRLRVFDKKGETFWESNENFGGTVSYLTEFNPSSNENTKRIWLSSPIMLADVYNDNKYKEIISVKNDDATNNLLSSVKYFNEGWITIFSVNDLSCSKVAQSEKITGFISWFDIKLGENKNDPLLAYSVVQKGQNIFSKKKSFIVIQNVNSLKRK